MRLSAVLFFLLIFWISTVNGQKHGLGKVSVKELEEKSYPSDSSAAAAILYNKAKSRFIYTREKGFTIEHSYEFRIKIYKAQGLDWANFRVPYYVGYENLNKDMVKFSDAVTYNLENGVIVKTKLSGEGKFKNDVDEFWNEASIAMPNVKPGSVIEFKYVLSTEDIVKFPVFRFQYDIPVKYSEYITHTPEFFIYKPILLGLRQIKSDAKIETGFQNYDDEYHQSVRMTYKEIKCTYTDENIPALHSEPFVDNINNYRSSLVHELERVRYPESPEKKYADTWENVAESIYKEEEFGKELQERQYFEKQIDPLIKAVESQTEKATAIFDYVKRNMNWDGKFGYLTKKGVKQAFADKTGNAAEINLILVSMLNHSGIQAFPVLISTQSNGIPAFPTRTEFNFVIAAATVDGKQVLYDATSKNASANILPFRDLNWTGRLIQPGGVVKEINLVPSTLSKKTINIVGQVNLQGELSGKAKILHSDYFGYGFREKYGTMNQENYLENFENQHGQIEVSDYIVENAKDVSKPIIESFAFTSDNVSETIGDKLYIDPMLFFTSTVNPFSSEERKFPIFFGYPNQLRYNISITLPEGYIVESVPKSLSLVTGENLGQFIFNILDKGNVIQISSSTEISQTLISSDFYMNIKGFYQKMIEKQNEKIVLKKV